MEDYLGKKGQKVPAKAPTPLSSQYRPEVDISEELGEDEGSYYHSLIGVLRSIVELGRVDICCELSMMSSHLALPRERNLEEGLHMFSYLKSHADSEMLFDPSRVEFDKDLFPKTDWGYSIYAQAASDSQEELPRDISKSRSKGMDMRVYVDSDHAGDTVTRRSRTGFVIFLNGAPIYWKSKKQTSCETSSFGSEFCAMNQATEYVKGFCYKLRMMGIPVEDPTFIFGDNQAVLTSTIMPESILKKKTQSIVYNFVQEGCARDEWRTAYISTHENVADMLTKPLPSGEKRWKFVWILLHHLAPQGL